MDWLEILFGGPSRYFLIRLSQALECKRFTRDLGLVMHKACFGRLPKGKYIEYHVYTALLSRQELCPFLDQDTLKQMDACTHIAVQELSCRMLSYTIDEARDMAAAITIAVTLRFEGQLADGVPVSVQVTDKRLVASLVIDKIHYWKLIKLKPIKG